MVRNIKNIINGMQRILPAINNGPRNISLLITINASQIIRIIALKIKIHPIFKTIFIDLWNIKFSSALKSLLGKSSLPSRK